MDKIKCKTCKKLVKIKLLPGRKSNGSFIRVDLAGRFIAANRCNDCKNKIQRRVRDNTNNTYTKKYEKTKSGFLMRTYRNMKSRTIGLVKPHLYKNLTLLSKEEFYSWSNLNKAFHFLFERWSKNNYDRKLTPSIDRIDSSLGYEISNMQWITHSENSGKTNRFRS